MIIAGHLLWILDRMLLQFEDDLKVVLKEADLAIMASHLKFEMQLKQKEEPATKAKQKA
jgi:hypothetical protein